MSPFFRFLVSAVVLVQGLAARPCESETPAFSLATAFTYQGRLQHDGRLAAGRYDLSFELYDAAAGGTLLGRVDLIDQEVRAGVVSSPLDFGRDPFAGEPAWLQVAVRVAGDGAFAALAPRQPLAKAAGVCTVSTDVEVDGNLTVGAGHQLAIGDGSASVRMSSDSLDASAGGGAATLQLNPGGGNVEVGGALGIFYQIVEQTETGSLAVVYCPDGKRVIGGGCSSTSPGTVYLIGSSPAHAAGLSGWGCLYAFAETVTAHAVCAKIF